MPIECGYEDIIVWSLYGSLNYPAGMMLSDRHSFFGGTYLEKHRPTNVNEPNMLYNPQHFNITHLQPAYSEANDPEDMANFKDNTTFELTIGNKVYFEAPMSIFSKVDLSNIVELLTMAQIAEKAGFKLEGNTIDLRIKGNPIGVHILQGQFFDLKLRMSNYVYKFVKPFKMNFFLHGVLSRGIQ